MESITSSLSNTTLSSSSPSLPKIIQSYILSFFNFEKDLFVYICDNYNKRNDKIDNNSKGKEGGEEGHQFQSIFILASVCKHWFEVVQNQVSKRCYLLSIDPPMCVVQYHTLSSLQKSKGYNDLNQSISSFAKPFSIPNFYKLSKIQMILHLNDQLNHLVDIVPVMPHLELVSVASSLITLVENAHYMSKIASVKNSFDQFIRVECVIIFDSNNFKTYGYPKETIQQGLLDKFPISEIYIGNGYDGESTLIEFAKVMDGLHPSRSINDQQPHPRVEINCLSGISMGAVHLTNYSQMFRLKSWFTSYVEVKYDYIDFKDLSLLLSCPTLNTLIAQINFTNCVANIDIVPQQQLQPQQPPPQQQQQQQLIKDLEQFCTVLSNNRTLGRLQLFSKKQHLESEDTQASKKKLKMLISKSLVDLVQFNKNLKRLSLIGFGFIHKYNVNAGSEDGKSGQGEDNRNNNGVSFVKAIETSNTLNRLSLKNHFYGPVGNDNFESIVQALNRNRSLYKVSLSTVAGQKKLELVEQMETTSNHNRTISLLKLHVVSQDRTKKIMIL